MDDFRCLETVTNCNQHINKILSKWNRRSNISRRANARHVGNHGSQWQLVKLSWSPNRRVVGHTVSSLEWSLLIDFYVCVFRSFFVLTENCHRSMVYQILVCYITSSTLLKLAYHAFQAVQQFTLLWGRSMINSERNLEVPSQSATQ